MEKRKTRRGQLRSLAAHHLDNRRYPTTALATHDRGWRRGSCSCGRRDTLPTRSPPPAAADPPSRTPTGVVSLLIPEMAGMEAFEAYFRRADLNQDGRISGQEAVAFFQGANLPQQVLAQVCPPNPPSNPRIRTLRAPNFWCDLRT